MAWNQICYLHKQIIYCIKYIEIGYISKEEILEEQNRENNFIQYSY